MEFIEATAFSKHVYDYLSKMNIWVCKVFYSNTQKQVKLFRDPAVLEKSAGLSQVVAKSGGVRVIYYFKKQDDEIWLLTIYSKNEIANIPAHILRQIAKEIENG